MHGMSFVVHQLGQCPESILLIKKHEQDGDNLIHVLAVAHLLQESYMAAGTHWEAFTTISLALAPQLLTEWAPICAWAPSHGPLSQLRHAEC